MSSMLAERDRIGLRTLGERISRATVLLAFGTTEARPAWNGSGTLIRTPCGNLVALTAKHNFEGWNDREIQVALHLTPDKRAPFAPVRFDHPGDCDVSVFALDRATSAAVPPDWPVEASQVVGLDPRTEPGAYCWLSGYPSATVRERLEPDRLWRSYANVVYRLPRGAIETNQEGLHRFDWQTAEWDDGTAETQLPAPHGMSGGGLWLLDPEGATDRKTVWASSKHLRLIGVQISWDPDRRRVSVEGAARWRAWFAEALTQLDEHLGPQELASDEH